MKYNRVLRLKNITAVLLLLNSMVCNIVEENGKRINAFIERFPASRGSFPGVR